ncbi:unnamed protein product [Closterium sp. NIES-65]|nr:unnamed protein product [Closterium sp. NIES-65]
MLPSCTTIPLRPVSSSSCTPLFPPPSSMQALTPLNPFYPSLSSFHASSIWLDVINTTVMPAFQPWHYSLSALPAPSPGVSPPPSPAPPVPAPASLGAVLSSALTALQGTHIDVCVGGGGGQQGGEGAGVAGKGERSKWEWQASVGDACALPMLLFSPSALTPPLLALFTVPASSSHACSFGRAVVLRVLLNLLADLHQPLHCADRQHVGGGEAAGGGVEGGEGVGPVGGGGWARQVAVEQYVVDEADTLFHFWSAFSPPPCLLLPSMPSPVLKDSLYTHTHTLPSVYLACSFSRPPAPHPPTPHLHSMLSPPGELTPRVNGREAAGGAFEEVAGAVRGDRARPAAAFHVDERDVRAAALALAAQFPLSDFTPREVQEVDLAAWAAGSGSITASVVYSGPLQTAAAAAAASASVPGTASPVLLTHDYNIHVQEVAKSQLALAAYRLAALLNASFPQPLSQGPDTYSPCISLQDAEERGARAAPLLATALGMAVAVALALVVMLYRERESMQRQIRDLQQHMHQDPHSPSGGLLASSQGL